MGLTVVKEKPQGTMYKRLDYRIGNVSSIPLYWQCPNIISEILMPAPIHCVNQVYPIPIYGTTPPFSDILSQNKWLIFS